MEAKLVATEGLVKQQYRVEEMKNCLTQPGFADRLRSQFNFEFSQFAGSIILLGHISPLFHPFFTSLP